MALAFAACDSGARLGCTIRDMAPLVGAGLSVGPGTGETAARITGIRASILAPVILALSEAAGQLSRWALLISIAAVGIKTSLKRMRDVGGGAIALIVAETLFLGVFVVAGLHLPG